MIQLSHLQILTRLPLHTYLVFDFCIVANMAWEEWILFLFQDPFDSDTKSEYDNDSSTLPAEVSSGPVRQMMKRSYQLVKNDDSNENLDDQLDYEDFEKQAARQLLLDAPQDEDEDRIVETLQPTVSTDQILFDDPAAEFLARRRVRDINFPVRNGGETRYDSAVVRQENGDEDERRREKLQFRNVWVWWKLLKIKNAYVSLVLILSDSNF